MLHLPSGELRAAPYDPHQNQCIYSIERKYLNELLLTETEAHENVKMHFGHKLIEANLESGLLKFQRVDTKEIVEQHADLVVGADGAFSSVRRHMMLRPHFDYSQQYCDHGYLELAIPPADNGQFAMPAEYLHLWPRGHCMMLAMPNRDHSWTVTLFLPFSLFNKLNSAQKLIKFFQINFPDSIPLIGRERLVDGFFKTKPSPLISIKCRPYHVSDRAVLLGDAAHAMVPFYGQGMNAGFEDCAILDQLLATRPVQEALQQFSDTRWKDAHAICDLALYNFSEISSRVAHRSWMARRSLDIALYGLLGCYWLPLYQAVCFTDCSYSECRAHQKRQNMVVNGVIGLFMMMTVIVIISSMKMIWPLTS